MKKIVALLLVAVMVIGLVACGGKTETPAATNAPATEAPATSGNETPATEAPATTGEVYRVKMKFPTMMTIPSTEAVKSVEDAINNYMKETLGVTDFELELELCSLFTYTDDIGMGLASGEKMDIIYTGPLGAAVDNGYLTDLTDMVGNELAGAVEYVKDWLICGTIDGHVWAIPCYKGQVLSWKYIYDKNYVPEGYDMSTIKNIKDLDDLFAAQKAEWPDEKFEVYCNQYCSMYNFLDHTSNVGSFIATVGDSTTLVNYFTTEAFQESCRVAYEHRQKGYADPEGSENTQSHDALIMSGACKGVIMGHAYSIETIEQMFTMNNTYGAEFGAVEIATSDMTTNALVYGIPYTSTNPSAAAKMMNLIWTDEFIASTLIYGLEGRDFVWNEGHTSIEYPEGLDINTVPYTALYTCGAFGNQFLLYGFDGNTSEADKVFMKELIDNAWYPPLFGFIPSNANISTQYAAVNNIYNTYFKALTYGDVNPDEVLPQFLSELETAGINDIIADYQAQVDAWLASK